jgi:thiol-disulfide isomerase/thioredoxin
MNIDTLESYNNINNIDHGEKIVIFKIGTEWCEPCKTLQNTLEKFSDVVIYKMDMENEEFESFYSENKIYNIPYCICKYNDVVFRFKGLLTEEALRDKFTFLRLG